MSSNLIASNNFVVGDYGVIGALASNSPLVDRTIKSFIANSTYEDIISSGTAIREALGCCRTIYDNDFPEFLLQNYNFGRGVRTSIVRSIYQLLTGRISVRIFIPKIRAEQIALKGYKGCTTNTRHVQNDDVDVIEMVRFLRSLPKGSVYELIELLGPVMFCQLMWTFIGGVPNG